MARESVAHPRLSQQRAPVRTKLMNSCVVCVWKLRESKTEEKRRTNTRERLCVL